MTKRRMCRHELSHNRGPRITNGIVAKHEGANSRGHCQHLTQALNAWARKPAVRDIEALQGGKGRNPSERSVWERSPTQANATNARKQGKQHHRHHARETTRGRRTDEKSATWSSALAHQCGDAAWPSASDPRVASIWSVTSWRSSSSWRHFLARFVAVLALCRAFLTAYSALRLSSCSATSQFIVWHGCLQSTPVAGSFCSRLSNGSRPGEPSSVPHPPPHHLPPCHLRGRGKLPPRESAFRPVSLTSQHPVRCGWMDLPRRGSSGQSGRCMSVLWLVTHPSLTWRQR